MSRLPIFASLVTGAVGIASLSNIAHAAIVISEVDAAGSGTAAYGADWFEVTNTGSAAQDITGWKVDDSSDAFATAVPLRNVTSIGAGQSVVFFEGNATGTTDATIAANFEAAWFGNNIPAGFTIGAYGGSGVGLSTTADGVNLFDASGNAITTASVSFGASTAGATFDNAAGLSGTISTASVAGTNGAFTSAGSSEIGSPGTIAATPEPASLALLSLGGLMMLRRRRA